MFLVPLDCIVGDWTAWSKPDQTGTITRIRKQLRPSVNGGEECPNMIENKKGLFSLLMNI